MPADPGICSGFAYKNCFSNKSKWVRRWFKLGRFEFGYAQREFDEIMKRSFKLQELDRVDYQLAPDGSYKHTLLLVMSKHSKCQDMLIGFDGEEEAKHWLNAINSQKSRTWNSVVSKSFEEMRKTMVTTVVDEHPEGKSILPTKTANQTPGSGLNRPSVGIERQKSTRKHSSGMPVC